MVVLTPPSLSCAFYLSPPFPCPSSGPPFPPDPLQSVHNVQTRHHLRCVQVKSLTGVRVTTEGYICMVCSWYVSAIWSCPRNTLVLVGWSSITSGNKIPLEEQRWTPFVDRASSNTRTHTNPLSLRFMNTVENEAARWPTMCDIGGEKKSVQVCGI